MSKANSHAQLKQETTLYKKTASGRYIPATDPWAYDGLREGWWLVKVQSGTTTIRQCVHPNQAELEAARKDAEEKITDILRHCLEAKPKSSSISPEFAKAWKRLSKKYGAEMLLLEYPSLYEAAEKILSELFDINTNQETLRKISPEPKSKTPLNIWQ
jgi:hypothetical protein